MDSSAPLRDVNRWNMVESVVVYSGCGCPLLAGKQMAHPSNDGHTVGRSVDGWLVEVREAGNCECGHVALLKSRSV